MRLRFFTIPVRDADDAAQELNQFLAAHRILAIDRHLVADGANSAWAICVSFDENSANPASTPGFGKRGKTDFKDVLTTEEFAVVARPRALRKDQAEADGVPAYALFTNEQLAGMVRRRATSAAALREIPGIGDARIEKYGETFMQILREAALPTLTSPDEA